MKKIIIPIIGVFLIVMIIGLGFLASKEQHTDKNNSLEKIKVADATLTSRIHW